MLKVFSTLKQQSTKAMLASAALLVSATSYGQDWQALGSASGISTGGVADVSIFASGGKGSDLVYVAYKNTATGGLSVLKYSGGSWSAELGGPDFVTASRNPKILANASGTPYVAFEYGSAGHANKVQVYTFDGTSWAPMTGGTDVSNANTGGTVFAYGGGANFYIGFSDGGAMLNVKKFNGSTYFPLSTAISSGISSYNSMALYDPNTPMVAYIDAGTSGVPKTAFFNGSSWTDIGALLSGSGYYTQIASGNGKTYAVVSDPTYGNQARAFTFSGAPSGSSSWSNVVDSGFTGNEADYNSLVVDSTHNGSMPVVAFCRNMTGTVGDGGKVNVMAYKGTPLEWRSIGSANFSAGDAKYTALAMNNYGDYFVAYSDASQGGKLVVMVYRNPLAVPTVPTVSNTLEVYPNPSTGSFTVKGKEKGTYSINNILGQTVQTIELNGANNFTITVSNLKIGTYFVHGAGINQKVVVTK